MADIDGDSIDSSLGGKPMMKVPKLSGENFEIWEKKIRMVLAEYNLENYIDNPPLPNMTCKAKVKAQKAANLLCANLTDGVFNTIVKKENSSNPYELWQMFKAVYASDSILASYEVWGKWEDTQFHDDMAAYITGIEECLAKFDSLGMIVPDFVICCSIISRITKKRPFFMQSLFGDLNSLGKPKFVINRLRQVGRFERTNKRKAPDAGAGSNSTSTALATNADHRKKKTYVAITCPGKKHNPAASHAEEDCWTLHPNLFKEHLEKNKKAKREKENGSSYHTTVGGPGLEADGNNIQPSFSYLSNSGGPQSQTTILDSGASNHMLTSLAYFEETNPVCIDIATGSGARELVAMARGNARLLLASGGTLTLKD
ncbi:hypothetical protein PTTG_30481, partial [Puccinia triticina 1-1 BBBD Race 1]